MYDIHWGDYRTKQRSLRRAQYNKRRQKLTQQLTSLSAARGVFTRTISEGGTAAERDLPTDPGSEYAHRFTRCRTRWRQVLRASGAVTGTARVRTYQPSTATANCPRWRHGDKVAGRGVISRDLHRVHRGRCPADPPMFASASVGLDRGVLFTCAE